MVTVIPSASSSLNTLVPGGPFRQYQLLEQIGVGGQAVVWSALDPKRKRIYAIKFNKILDADESRAEELGIEQKFEKLVTLQHDHILPLQEFGSEERVRFMVSPYIPGGTLSTKIRMAPLSVDAVLRYGVEIASALDYLHSQGVIHRDLKASNILLDLSNHTYLADFGLARLVSTSTLAFHTGHGTPPYSPPEQVRSKEITPKSDIYSFGILLFEMFTGQLPWAGNKQLGVEQLHSAEVLPDPREQVPELPLLLAEVLRRVTSAKPDQRPRSASEVMKMIYYVFNRPFESVQGEMRHDELAARNQDAKELLRHGLSQWESTDGRSSLGLTKFALIDLECGDVPTEAFRRFMLSQALTYGYHDDQWWEAVSNPRERLLAASALLKKENEVITARVLDHLASDSAVLTSPKRLPESMAASLLSISMKTNDVLLRHKIFTGMRALTRPAKAWNDPPLNQAQVKRLGVLALEDSDVGDAAAALIGHLRSPSALRVVVNHFDEGRKLDTLSLIQRTAGGLPSLVPVQIRSKLALEWIFQRLTQQPANLISAYLVAFLGAALGVGTQAYMTYNLPNFFDIARVTTSIERGLIIGAILGLGIFLSRLVTERFPGSNTLLRIVLGTLIGGVTLNIAFWIFHVLYLNTPSSGILLTLGCLSIALAFAVGGLLRSRLIRIMLSSVFVLAAILGTWLLHVGFAVSQVEWTPLFKYDYAWSLAQVGFTAMVVALSIGIFGNLVKLSLRDQSS